MASPLQSGKKSVDLAAKPRVSRIRRDPPPVAKKVEVRDPEAHDTRTVVIGVVSFAVALFIVMLGFSAYQGSPSKDYTIHVNSL